MNTQEIMTTALRAEAAKALSDAAYRITYKHAGIDEVREAIGRAITALEMSLPSANCSAPTLRQVR